jgi:hypothetical protein
MTPATLEELGPVDIVVIGYPVGAPMTGSAAQVFLDEVNKGTIRVLDAMFVTKHDDGSYSGIEATNLEEINVGAFRVLEGASSGLLGDEDAATAAEALAPGTSAVMIIYENRWAAPFIAAVHENGGVFVDHQRIRHQDLLDSLEAS